MVASSDPKIVWHEWEGKGPAAWCYGHQETDDPDIQALARKFIQRLGLDFRSLLLVHGGVQYSPESEDVEPCAPCSEELLPEPATWVFVV